MVNMEETTVAENTKPTIFSVLPNVLQFLSLERITVCQRVCKKWNNQIVNDNSLWKDVLISILKKCESNYENDFVKLNERATIPGADWRVITKQMLCFPFSLHTTDLDNAIKNKETIASDLPHSLSSAFTEYYWASGVIEWALARPHDSWLALYDANIPAFLHEFGIVATLVNKFDKRQDWHEIKMNKIDAPAIVVDSSLLVTCADSPYGLQWERSSKEEVEGEIKKNIYSQYKGWNWLPNSLTEETSWANYWTPGLEWWGCYAQTHYCTHLRALVVSPVSATD